MKAAVLNSGKILVRDDGSPPTARWRVDASALASRSSNTPLVGMSLPGVVRLAGSGETFESKAMALQLHAGGQSFLSGVTAAAMHGMRRMPRRPTMVPKAETIPAGLRAEPDLQAEEKPHAPT